MNERIQAFFASLSYTSLFVGFGLAALVLFIFQAGVFVGYRKASFANKFGHSYERVFLARENGEFMPPMPGDFPSAHGAFGRVVGISLPTFAVLDPEGTEKIVVVGEDTRIRRFDRDIEAVDIRVNDGVVVIGEPNDASQIEAKLIRMLPEPPEERTK